MKHGCHHDMAQLGFKSYLSQTLAHVSVGIAKLIGKFHAPLRM